MAREINPSWISEQVIGYKSDYLDSPYFHIEHKGQWLLHKQTPFCKLEILFNPLFGNMMFINDEIQISELDYVHYHRMMWKVAGLYHSQPKVLVLGDGDGGFTQFHQFADVTIVDRDLDVIKAGGQYFGAEWDKVDLQVKSIEDFEPDSTYDAIFLAIDDGFNTSDGLENHLDRIMKWLRPMGKLVAQAGTDLDPKHPGIAKRYVKWAKENKVSHKFTKVHIQCYFCHENFFVGLK